MKVKGSLNISFVTMAVFLLWVKTYIVYKTSFDIKIETLSQEFILFINPLSFLMFIFGISFWIKQKNRTGYIITISFFISFILVSINRGYDHQFLSAWLKTWSQAFICAFFGAYFFPRVIQQIMRRINFVEKPLMIEKDLLEKKTMDDASR